MEEIYEFDNKLCIKHLSILSGSFGERYENPLLRDYYITHDIFGDIRNQTKMEIEQNDN